MAGWQDAPEVGSTPAWMSAPEVGAAPARLDTVPSIDAGRAPSRLLNTGDQESGVHQLLRQILSPIGDALRGLKGAGDVALSGASHAVTGAGAAAANLATGDQFEPQINSAAERASIPLQTPEGRELAGAPARIGAALSDTAAGRAVNGTTDALPAGVKQTVGDIAHVGGQFAQVLPAVGAAAKAAELSALPSVGTELKPDLQAVADNAGFRTTATPDSSIAKKIVNTVAGGPEIGRVNSVKNQTTVTNARRNMDMGLPSTAKVTAADIDETMKPHSQAYGDIAAQVPTAPLHPDIADRIANIGAPRGLSPARPEILKARQDILSHPEASGQQLVTEVGDLRSKAANNINGASATDSTVALGHAQREMADALEDEVAARLQVTAPDRVGEWQYHRQQLGMLNTYRDVQVGENTDAQKLGRLVAGDKNGRIMGNQRLIGEVAQQFPHDTRLGQSVPNGTDSQGVGALIERALTAPARAVATRAPGPVADLSADPRMTRFFRQPPAEGASGPQLSLAPDGTFSAGSASSGPPPSAGGLSLAPEGPLPAPHSGFPGFSVADLLHNPDLAAAPTQSVVRQPDLAGVQQAGNVHNLSQDLSLAPEPPHAADFGPAVGKDPRQMLEDQMRAGFTIDRGSIAKPADTSRPGLGDVLHNPRLQLQEDAFGPKSAAPPIPGELSLAPDGPKRARIDVDEPPPLAKSGKPNTPWPKAESTAPNGNGVHTAPKGGLVFKDRKIPAGAKVIGNENEGALAMVPDGDNAYKIQIAAGKETGAGKGKTRLLDAADTAENEGKDLHSDTSVSASQLGVYESLKKAGKITYDTKYQKEIDAVRGMRGGRAIAPDGESLITNIKLATKPGRKATPKDLGLE